MTAFYFGQTTSVSRILALEAISLMSSLFGSWFGAYGRLERASLASQRPKRRFYFGHSLFDQCKIRHFEFRAYIPRHIQRSTNVDVAHLVIRRSTKVNFVILSSEPTALDRFNARPT